MGKLAQRVSIIFFQALAFAWGAQAEEVPLNKVWREISQSSPALKAVELQSEAATEAEARAGRHWLPKVYLDAKSYQTDAPGQSFFGLLEQRSLRQSDFNPDTINNPGSETFTRGALGLALPLYEGGIKSSQYSLQTHLSQSAVNESQSARAEQYTQVAKIYGSVGLIAQQRQKLLSLKQVIDRLLKNYQLGVKSNPVGYSGLLGLKSLANRIQGLLDSYEAQSRAGYVVLKDMGYPDSNWKPQFDETISFVENYLNNQNQEPSFQVESMKAKGLVAQEASEMQKASFLPQFGAFAESYFFSGSRDTTHGYTAGLYLQWSLFNPADYGAHKEARLRSLAAQRYAEAIEQKEKAENSSLQKIVESIKSNIRLLEDSQKILVEQSKVTESLFKNGSINALQFVEVLNRRVDLIVTQTEANQGLLDVSVQKVLKARFVLPAEKAQGK